MTRRSSLDHPAYKFQKMIREKFLAGQNLIVQAPTGAGKTRAALEPGIIGFQRQPATVYPHRIIYNVPMRVLAHGFLGEYSERAQRKHWDVYWHPTIQTGDSPEDPLFEGRVIFATVDQMLAGFLNIPYGLPTRLDNINAGAMIGSYLIFDEFHLYPRDQMMLTVLAMLKMLAGVSRFMLMSATFSPVFLHEIGRVLGAEVIADEPGTPLDKGLFCDIKALKTRTRTFFAEEGKLTAQAVMQRTTNAQRILCVCNTIDRAQQLYRDLRRMQPDVECRLLHSRFFREDRRRHEEFVEARFKAKGSEKVVLVATQVVEVGLDISSDVLLTECAPAASLIQRAGRCARREGETGEVYVFQPIDDEGNVTYAPYLDSADDEIEAGQEEVCRKTWDALRSDEFNGRVMGFPQEQRLVELAHSAADAVLVRDLEEKIDRRIADITQCMATREGAYANTLIRQQDQNAGLLYIHPDPNQDKHLTTSPWQREALNISKGRIARALKALPGDPADLDADFLFMSGSDTRTSDDDTDAAFQWRAVQDSNDVFRNRYFVAHPNIVTYASDTGLLLVPGEQITPLSPLGKARTYERPHYHAERYHEHLAGLMFAYTRPRTANVLLHDGHREDRSYSSLADEVAYALHHLCARLGRDMQQAERLLRLTLALHDIGKLNVPWQAWAQAWQTCRVQEGYSVGLPLDDPDPLAHTDFDSASDVERELQRQLNRHHPPRGNHAGESAEACLPVLWEATGGDDFWLRVVVATIMHHHTPDVDGAGVFRMVPYAERTFIEALRVWGFGEQAPRWFGMLQTQFERGKRKLKDCAEAVKPKYSDYDTALMYLLFVRVLRLADQRSGNYWQQYRDSKPFESEIDE